MYPQLEVNPRWDESFLIPGADGTVKLVFTVVDLDELRNDFLGWKVHMTTTYVNYTLLRYTDTHHDMSLDAISYNYTCTYP